jgi:7-cyano-7-deazaguanine reductase
MDKVKKTYEGLQENVRKLKTPSIEVWQNKYADRDYMIHLTTDEFTCICPKTGLPDFATIKVDYKPDQRCLELKSFKYYLMFYRDIGIFHEHLTNKILDDICKACQPRFVKVEVLMKPRGGIETVVSAEYPKTKNV